jgi:hypothetical protein
MAHEYELGRWKSFMTFAKDVSAPVNFTIPSSHNRLSMSSPASATLASVQAALAALQAGQMSLNQVAILPLG